ncbi:integral membrane protein, TerC family [Schaalia georgiae F0490]|uniref:Integral membrane protein, TerC family n=1 Tax=Schaalia georgiae F0490 TaxID=1125717 RepID=J0P2D9_9ACTO|nr:TerC/Alx family metal homeostasis membrane protein [Schaalia georgiae]EJF51557.1 integral membrane protein, TerC family [Schaalia georgiae F0490]
MTVHPWAWAVLAVVALALFAFDFAGHARRPHPPSSGEALRWTLFYAGLAVLFGIGVWLTAGAAYAQEFYTGWAMEWSLSVDNLFVFILIMRSFRVPREYQQKALLFGIVIALVLRLAFILAGAALVSRFSAVFLVFGLWLEWTAFTQVREALRGGGGGEEYRENGFVRRVRRVLPVTDGYTGNRFLHRHGGRTSITPLFLVVMALGSADLMFAFDSIPAIFGVTSEPFLVFSCTVFALMGLRQLFFLVDSLLSRLVYLGFGLGAVLAFIGVKLILEALRGGALPFVAGGAPLASLPEIPSALSLCVVVSVLAVTVVASLVASSTKEGTTRE